MMTDPIADMLSRIRNASIARLEHTEIPRAKLKTRIAEILKEQGYIRDFRVEGEKPGTLTVYMKYAGRDRDSAICGLQRASRPGRRFYVGHHDVPRVHNGLGIAILSTSHGVMTDREARERRIGGEVLCEVW